jgi:hypothetical protein
MHFIRIYLASCLLLFAFPAFATNEPIAAILQKQTLLDKKQKSFKSGTYFGLQSGRFYVLEYGWELQRKNKNGMLRSNTTAVHHGFNATFDFAYLNPVLGYDLGFWSRTGNLNLTYGLSAAVRTDLKQLRFGICPSVGIKVWQLHVQTGMYLLAPFSVVDNTTFKSNSFFISARFLLIKHKTKKGDN